jgi:threonine synthase
LRKLVERGEVSADDQVVLFNTGAGIKYIEELEQRAKPPSFNV